MAHVLSANTEGEGFMDLHCRQKHGGLPDVWMFFVSLTQVSSLLKRRMNISAVKIETINKSLGEKKQRKGFTGFIYFFIFLLCVN